MPKSMAIKSATVLLVVGLLSLAVWDGPGQSLVAPQRLLSASYQTTANRTSNVNTYCPSSVDRSTLAPASDTSAAQTNMNGVRSQISIDGNALMNKLLAFDFGGALSIVVGGAIGLGIFVGSFLLPFLVFTFAWPFLCCCCCCPASCPSKCCQQKEGEPYTRCELRWPAAILILSLLTVISISCYGFSSASKVGPTFQNLSCSLAIFTDDLLNGNVTLSGTSFFTGLNTFSNNLNKLSGNLSTINTAFSDLASASSGTSYTAYTNVGTVQTNYVKKIPDNTGTATMSLNYNTPITAATPTGTLASSFISILGKWDSANTLMANLYNSIESVRLTMQGIRSSASIFSGQVATIQSQITPMQTTITDLISSINSMDSGLSSFLSILNMGNSFGSIGLQGYYGFLIAFSAFSLLGVIVMCCCDKPGCRNLMYFSCIFLFIGAFVAFFIAVIFSVLVPIFTWTCDYLSVGFGSRTGFYSNFGVFLSNSTLNQISVCMPFGDGRIVSTIAGSAANGLNNLTNVITGISSFDNVTFQTYITGNLSALVTTANAYANSDISDLDATNSNILAGLSDPANTTNNINCNSSFTSDSWVPSNNQNTSYSTAVSCKVTSANTGSISTCSATLTPTTTCKGCMDTTQLLSQITSSTNVASAIQGKYGSSCAFGTILSNTWTNYFNKKYTALGFPTAKTQVSGSVMYRIQQSLTQINNTGNAASAFSAINSFKGVLNTANTSLASIQSLTDPTYGLLAGLNCKLFGEDFQTFQNVICGSFYNSIYTIRLTFGIAAWGLLFAMCCTVCSGVRHFKQIGKVKGNQVSDSSVIIRQNSFDDGSKRIFRGRGNRYEDD